MDLPNLRVLVNKAIGLTFQGLPVVLFFIQFSLYHLDTLIYDIRSRNLKPFSTFSKCLCLLLRQTNF